MYFELRLGILDQKCVKKAKCFVVFDLLIQNFDLFVPQSTLFILYYVLPILQIEAWSNSLLYTESIVTFLMSLLTTVQ